MELLDSKTLMKKFHGFFEEYKRSEIRKSINDGLPALHVSFFDISEYDIELGDQILAHPEDCIKLMEETLKQFYEEDVKEPLRVRLSSLPATEKLMIRDIRSEHLGKLVVIEGLVRRKTDVRPRLKVLEYLCTNPSCSFSEDKLKIPQTEEKAKTIKACPKCKSGVELINKQLVDSQMLVLEERPEHLKNSSSQPKRINVLLQDDLVTPFKESKTNPGSNVYVIGLIREIPIQTRTGSDSINYDLIVEGNFIDLTDDDISEITWTKEDEKKIKELAANPDVEEILVKNTAPSIYGYNRIKESILLQQFGGTGGTKGDGVKTRGDIHILLIGDPGAAKSQMLKAAGRIAPKSSFVSGKSATGAGLVASVIKDELTKGWALEAGAMVLASGGLCCTTADAQFITEDYTKMSFGELFEGVDGEKVIYPKFKVLGLDTKTGKIKPFKIKHAFKKKNDKRILKIKTRTGRELKLTEDNEVYTIENSVEKWKKIGDLVKGNYLAVPKKYDFNSKLSYDSNLAYLAGLIATDGHIKIDQRHSMVSIYNTNKDLIEISKQKFDELGFNSSVSEKDRSSEKGGLIRGKRIVSKQISYTLYNCQKEFAKKLIEFGVPSGNKSTEFALSSKILKYDDNTVKEFLKGVFDGDGSIRKNPYEVTITTGILENARLYQELFLRFGIISSVKKSTNSWHCDIRGKNQCDLFFNKIGTNHNKKFERLSQLKANEVKDRIDILPNCQDLFKSIRKSKKGQLGSNIFKYIWNYSREGVEPSIFKLSNLNERIQSDELNSKVKNDILWDKIVSIAEIQEEYVYDFTMIGAENFVANNIIMHNCIDEMDKMTDEDTSSMHEALEQQTVSVAKANIRATLRCETTVLGAANPKMGRFDPYGDIGKQINFPPALISRFDLIFILRDIPDKKKDDLIADHILQTHRDKTKSIAELDVDFIRKYIAYTRQIKPVLTKDAIEKIKEFYVSMRNAAGDEENEVKSVPITARQLEAIVRLAEAYAKIKLDKKVRVEYAQKAIDLLLYCLQKIGIDPKTGELDIDRITTGVTASTRNQYKVVQQIIDRLEIEKPEVTFDDICDEAEKQKIKRGEVQRVLDKLKNEGIIFEPRKNRYKKLL